MIDNVMGEEPTEENIARHVAGVEASAAGITAVLKSKKSEEAKRLEVIANMRFIDTAFESEAIKNAVPNVEEILAKHFEGRQFLISINKPVAGKSRLEGRLQELGL